MLNGGRNVTRLITGGIFFLSNYYYVKAYHFLTIQLFFHFLKITCMRREMKYNKCLFCFL